MCGIVGYISIKNFDTALKKATGLLAHRGPDGEGFFSCSFKNENQVGLGFRRLAIQDTTPAGNQPMIRGDTITVLNGEIYNAEDLRNVLKDKGYTFFSSSDTEILPYAYKEWGEKFVGHLNGIFAFCIIDQKLERVVIGRDRLGIKPLYVYQDSQNIFFASEIKALFEFGIPKKINFESLQRIILSEWFIGMDCTNTFFKDVFLIPSGTIRIISSINSSYDNIYYTLNSFETSEVPSFPYAGEHVSHLIRESVREELIGDVPIAVSVSGGIDSSLIAALAVEEMRNRRIDFFTASYENNGGEEDVFCASLLVRYLKERGFFVEHTIINLNNCYSEELLETTTWNLETPVTDWKFMSINDYARSIPYKVLLSGNGGNETFYGYRDNRLWISGLYHQSSIEAIDIADYYRKSDHGEKRKILNEEFVASGKPILFNHFEQQLQSDNHLSKDRRFSLFFVRTALQAALRLLDSLGMAHAMEVRSPYLHSPLFEYSFSLPPEYHYAQYFGGRFFQKSMLESRAPREIVQRLSSNMQGRRGYLPDVSELLRSHESGIRRSSIIQAVYSESFLKNIPLILKKLDTISPYDSPGDYFRFQFIFSELLGIYFFERVFLADQAS